MAAEFAQSKRCYSTISTKIQHINKNTDNKNKPNNKLSYQGLQEIINMNNLKQNLPGKAKPIIDNTDNIIKTNYEDNIKEEENNEEINLDGINNCFSQNNINITNKNQNNNELSQPCFDDIRHLTNKSNANNEFNNNLIPPYELENDANEETSKFGNEAKIIDTNKSRKIEVLPEKHFEIINKGKYDKLKHSLNTYVKKRPIRDDNNHITSLLKSKNNKTNSNDNNPVNISISFRNDFNKNNSSNNNLGNKSQKKENKNINENINSNELNIKYNENKNNDMNRYVETNNNEENDNNIEFFKTNEKIINIDNNSNNENNNIEENNLKDNNTINTQNTQNELSNDIMEETNVIKVNEEISNGKEKQIKKEDNNINYRSNIYVRENNLKRSFKTIEEKDKSIKVIKNEEKNRVNKTIDISDKQKESKNFKISKNNNNQKTLNFKCDEKTKDKDIYLSNNENLNINKSYNNFNKIPSQNMRNKNNKKNEKNKNKNVYSLMISKDIERLNKLKQSSQRNKETNYFNEINSFIDNIKKKREIKINEYINLTNENREKLIELQNQKKDLKSFQNQINSALNYNKNKISFNTTKNFNEHKNIINFNNFNNNKNRKDYKVKITTRMQGLLNELEKEKISSNIEKNVNYIKDINNDDDDNKRIFTQNVINSINNFIETENNRIISNNQINHINNINNNNHNNNFILLQNYYNNENNYINNRKNKKDKKNYFNYISFDDIKKSNDRNIISNREAKPSKNKNIQLNKNDINALDEKIYKLIRTKNNRSSKSKPNTEINLNANNKRITFLNDEKYNIYNNNSKRYDKSSDFLDGHYYLDKLNEINKNKDIDLFKAKSKRNWNSLNLFGINNKIKINDENNEMACGIVVMAV